MINRTQKVNLKHMYKKIAINYELYILILPAFLYFIIFHYWPMYGVQIAFRDFVPTLGITGSPWVGLKHLSRFISSYHFVFLLRNTFLISIYGLVVGFPAPIILALMLNEVQNTKMKKFAQTITYAPHFISTVVLVGMITIFLSPTVGIINKIIVMLGGEETNFLQKADWFRTIYVFSGVWKEAGFSSIIYLAALTGIDPQLHDAARVDGANRMQRIWHVNIPGIIPTATILLIMSMGRMLSVGFEKAFLLQNSLNMETSDIIATYVYRVGLQGAKYSYSTAVGLFNSVINFVLLFSFNAISRKLGETSLW